ncbi:MAG: hypothetical protein V4563_17480 [Pseudomonadota bacterium]
MNDQFFYFGLLAALVIMVASMAETFYEITIAAFSRRGSAFERFMFGWVSGFLVLIAVIFIMLVQQIKSS